MSSSRSKILKTFLAFLSAMFVFCAAFAATSAVYAEDENPNQSVGSKYFHTNTSGATIESFLNKAPLMYNGYKGVRTELTVPNGTKDAEIVFDGVVKPTEHIFAAFDYNEENVAVADGVIITYTALSDPTKQISLVQTLRDNHGWCTVSLTDDIEFRSDCFPYVAGTEQKVIGLRDGATALSTAETPEKPVYFKSAENIVIENDAPDTRGVTGVAITLKGVNDKEKASFDYQNYISKSELAGGFLELAFMPQTAEKADFDYALVTLTDAKDDSQKLVYAVAPQPDTAEWWNYWSAAWVGYTDDVEAATSVKYMFNSMLKIRGTEQYLTGFNQSFIAPTHIYYTGPYMEVGYNLGAKRQFFVKETATSQLDSLTFALSGTSATVNNNVIANLTDENYMSASGANLMNTPYENLYTREHYENLFSSGYCKLRVTFMGCNSDDVTCHIRKIGSQWIESNAGHGVKNASPMFTVKHETHAVAGVPFKLPETSVTDFREGDITAKAVYSFASASGDEVGFTGGEVTFPAAGNYEMTCSVSLVGGEKFSVTRPVTCYAKMPKTVFSVNADYSENYKTGDTITVAKAFAVNDLSTAQDKAVPVIAVLQCGGRTVEVFDCGGNNYYTFTEAGRYTLDYVFQNAYGEISAVHNVFTVTESLGITPEFLPVTLTSAKENKIADCKIFNYVNETSVKDIYRAAYVGGTRVFLAKGGELLEGGFTFNGALTGTEAELIYKAGFDKDNLVYEKRYVIPVISPQYAEDYIVQYDNEGSYERAAKSVLSGEEVIFAVEKDTGFMLPQPLPANGLEFSFDVKAGGAYKCVNVVLRDYADYNKRIVFSLRQNNATTSLLYVNGVYEATVNGSLINDKNYFQWSFGSDNVLKDAAGNSLTRRVTSWSDGSAFDGFAKKLAVLAFELEGVSSETRFALKRVNNQPFFTDEIGGVKQRFSDVYAPIIMLQEKADYDKTALGDIAAVPAAAAYDVLSPKAEIEVSVTDPDGNVLTEINDPSVHSGFVVDKLGMWTVRYVAYGENKFFVSEQRFTFDIKDKTPPVIRVNGSVPSTAKVGKQVKLPTAYVFDNVTKDCGYNIIIIASDGTRRVVKDNAYTFATAGKYTVQYYAFDGYMNVARASYEITVM